MPSARIVRREQHAALGAAAARERVVDALQHLLRAHVGQETEPAAVDAEHRHVRHGGHARGMQHGAVAADRDDQVGVERQVGFEHRADTGALQRPGLVGDCADRVPVQQVLRQQAHRFADARVGGTAGEGDTGGTGCASVHRVACLLARRAKRSGQRDSVGPCAR